MDPHLEIKIYHIIMVITSLLIIYMSIIERLVGVLLLGIVFAILLNSRDIAKIRCELKHNNQLRSEEIK